MFEIFDYLESVSSTNDYLKQFLPRGQTRIVLAREQTAGKGRYGKEWYSLSDLGLYVSYLFFPQLAVRDARFLNMLFSLSVQDTILEFGRASLRGLVTVKAPNDLLIRDRKVCGILAEIGSVNDQIGWAIVGIGVNLNHQEFPEELSETATSLKLEGIKVECPLDFCKLLTEKIVERLARLRTDAYMKALEQEYRNKTL